MKESDVKECEKENQINQQIELKIDGKKVLYHNTTGNVTFLTRNGILIDSEMPMDWDLVRIFTFMESLIKADEILN